MQRKGRAKGKGRRTSPTSFGNVASGIRTGILNPLYTTLVSYQCVSFGLIAAAPLSLLLLVPPPPPPPPAMSDGDPTEGIAGAYVALHVLR